MNQLKCQKIISKKYKYLTLLVSSWTVPSFGMYDCLSGSFYICPQCQQSHDVILLQSSLPLVSLVFCCYQQVYNIFNTSCLGPRGDTPGEGPTGRDGISTPQAGTAAHSVSRICQSGLPLPSMRFSSS